MGCEDGMKHQQRKRLITVKRSFEKRKWRLINESLLKT